MMTKATGDIEAGEGRLELLRQPFPPHQIGKLPKGTKAQNDCPASEKISCAVCDGWHHPGIKHLDYVGHAALTDRLLDCDPKWTWEPMALDGYGLPRFDETGGLWIRLTVCGVTRLGYGNAEKKSYMEIGAREKEVLGDALRNAAMRFGAALDLWHKGDLHNGNAATDRNLTPRESIAPPAATDPEIVKRLNDCLSVSSLQYEFGKLTLENRRAHYAICNAKKLTLTAA